MTELAKLYGHLSEQELLPLLQEAERNIRMSQGILDAAVCAKEALESIIIDRRRDYETSNIPPQL